MRVALILCLLKSHEAHSEKTILPETELNILLSPCMVVIYSLSGCVSGVAMGWGRHAAGGSGDTAEEGCRVSIDPSCKWFWSPKDRSGLIVGSFCECGE